VTTESKFITTASPTIVRPAKPPKKVPALVGGWKTAVILPDPQFGYRMSGDASNPVMDPFHDEAAIDVATQVLAAVSSDTRVDLVVNLGDYLDLPAQSKYEQVSHWQQSTQAAIDAGHLWLAKQRATVPKAQIVLLEGNHDKRLTDTITKFNMASAGLRRASTPPSSWPVMSAPFLLDVDSLDVEWLDGYPARKFWINDHIKCVHGSIVRSTASTASAYSRGDRTSTIFGHIHRIEIHHTTQQDRYGPVRNFAATPGCLCRVDGAVPSMKGAQTLSGVPIKSYEDWQQGLLVLRYRDDSPRFVLDAVHIQGGWAMYGGQEFVSWPATKKDWQ
jgi:predicted phosphodiesterase